MSDKPTGVFVRLPLSGAQRERYLEEINSGEPLEAEARALEAGLVAIGTPVTGGDIPIAGFIAPKQAEKAILGTASPMTLQPRGSGGKRYTVALVRQSDAQSHIAALEAEIVRLRERYGAIRWRFIQDARIEGRTLTERQFDSLVDNDDEAHKALKGGAP